jgi:beta-xylosidase
VSVVRPACSDPVIGGFNPDPSVCRVGEDYYLATSSFEYVPGIPIYHSRDLVHWRQIGNAVDRPSQLAFPDSLPPSHGIWAPTLRHHDGRFWLATHVVGGGGNAIFTAEQAAGPWSDPVFLDLPGIDPDLAWHRGDCWCATSGIRIARIDPRSGRVLEGPVAAWGGAGGAYPEGPHLVRRGAWWYLLVAEGGTEHGHGVTVARSRSPRGPWTPGPDNPILTHRSTDRPVQSTGHADLVQTPDGDWWMVLLATRPRGASPRFHVLGRETFLAPVAWRDGWPVVGPIEAPGPAPARWQPHPAPPAPRDDFDDPSGLDAAFISPRSRPAASWSLSDRPGWLTLHATGPTLDRAPYTWVGKRQGAPTWAVATRVDPVGDAVAGLSIRLDEAHHYDIEVEAGRVSASARIGPLRQVLAAHACPPGPVQVGFRITAGTGTGGGPDEVEVHVHGRDAPLVRLDGRYVSTEVATGFTGRVIGMYVTRGTAHFDWYEASGGAPNPDAP